MDSENLKKAFGTKLHTLRKGLRGGRYKEKGPTLKQLAEDSGVPHTTISALENGNRNVGETVLRKLAGALDLKGREAEEFLLQGLNTAARDRLLASFSHCPAELLNAIAMKAFPNFDPAGITEVVWPDHGADLCWVTEDGKHFAMEITITTGRTRNEAIRKLKRRLGKNAQSDPGRKRQECYQGSE